MAALQILLGGQDITLHVDVTSIEIDDTLGQGSGAGSSNTTQGRATTIKMNSDLGPAMTALGAGLSIPAGGPYLIRGGNIVVKDANGNAVFGGFATKYTDISLLTKSMTTIEGIDYSTSLQRINIQETFSAKTDIQMINYLVAKYAPWVNLQYTLTSAPAYTFTTKYFHNVTLEQALQTIAGVTGYAIWVDFNKNLHYVSPYQASTAPFSLSDQPDFRSTFPHNIEQLVQDDNSAINRVYFYGGKRQSVDFVQDVSPLANGNNTTFVFAYYPRPDSTGAVRVSVGGVFKTIGDVNGTSSTTNTFKSAGGLADCLINYDARTVQFDVAPATGSTVLLYYRYDYPLVVVVTDETSHRYFGDPYYDGVISDDTIFDTQQAIQRCKVVLYQQSFGILTLQAICWKAGLQAGQLMHIVNAVRGLNGTYIIQEVKADYIGSVDIGVFKYEVTMGAWNWNLVDVVTKLAVAATQPDDSTSSTTVVVTVQQAQHAIVPTFSLTVSSRTMGGYYARATAVGDGHDAFPGFTTITS